jgi:hypothetical protein
MDDASSLRSGAGTGAGTSRSLMLHRWVGKGASLLAVTVLLAACGSGAPGASVAPNADEERKLAQASGRAVPGTDPRLDRLLLSCEAGSLADCETVYWDSPLDSEYEERALAAIPVEELAGVLERRSEQLGLSDPPGSGSGGSIEPDAEPYFGTIDLAVGFPDDPHLVEVLAGGSADTSDLPVECRFGSVSFNPDVRLRYRAGSLPLHISAYAAREDLTLIVRLPDGRFLCNDDHTGLDPAVSISDPRSGTYEVWVGVYDGEFAEGVIAFSELAPYFG